MIILVRSGLTNAERLANPVSEADAWILLGGAPSIDTRRLAAHRLLDIAIEQQDPKKIHQVVEFLKDVAPDVCAHGLLCRIGAQQLDVGWMKWARWFMKNGPASQEPVQAVAA